MIRSATYVLSSLRRGEHRNAVRWVHCPNCLQSISADRYELHRLICKPPTKTVTEKLERLETAGRAAHDAGHVVKRNFWFSLHDEIFLEAWRRMRHARDTAGPLTPDQSYAMTRLCEGAKCREIAREMAVQPSGISQHLRRAARRLGTDSRVVACTRFMQTEAWTKTHGR